MRKTSNELKQILAKINELQINTEEKLKASGIEYKYLGKGMDRQAFELLGTPWIIKMNRDKVIYDAVEQWRLELQAIEVLRNDKKARKYLPGVLWISDNKNAAVMLRYKKIGHEDEDVLDIIVQEMGGVANLWDIHLGNIGIDMVGRYKILDLGRVRL